MTQLADLASPFPDRWVQTKDTGKYQAAYVEHSVITQRLLEVCGGYCTDVVEVVRGSLDLTEGSGRDRQVVGNDPNAVVGVVLRLTVELDGGQVSVTEAGDVGDNAGDQNDGQRLKDAMSDALKRCAMRLGCGLHLWAQDHYYLDRSLAKRENGDG